MRPPFVRSWADDPPWATVYDWSVEHPRVGGLGWRVAVGSDLGLLYAAAAEVGTLPAGSVVLDVPCGGGVALRGLRPGQGVTYLAADIAQAMLDRTMTSARSRGVADQVEPQLADVGALPLADGSVDLVVTFTGLHCFPDPHRAVVEMVRVLRPGGVLTGSSMFTDTGRAHAPARRMGTLAGVLGPMCTTREAVAWLTDAGCRDVELHLSGGLGYFRAIAG
jgi:ubiquinone/menaquinone biosynthesis C-methylase UbiE